ncbi:unnamed protein product, partial [Hapterophycus canaliculatus]
MTPAIATCWENTLHLNCLWHIFKNVVKNCSPAFTNAEDKKKLMRLFRSAAYAAAPEVRKDWVGAISHVLVLFVADDN